MLTDHWKKYPDDYDFIERDDRKLVVNTMIADGVESICEFAMGTGIIPKMLRERGYKGRYVGTDIMENFIEASRRNNPEEEIKYSDLNEALPFKDKEFDAVCIFTGLGYLKDIENTLREFKRITREFIYIDQFNLFAEKTDLRFWKWEGMGNQYSKKEFDEIIERIGLKKDIEVDITNYKDEFCLENIPTSKVNYFLKLKL